MEAVPAGMETVKMPDPMDTSIAFEFKIGFNEMHYKKPIYEVLENGLPAGTEEGEELVEKMIQRQELHKLEDGTFDRIELGGTVVKEGEFQGGILVVDYAKLAPGLNPVANIAYVKAYFIIDGREEKFSTEIPAKPLWQINNIAKAQAELNKNPDSPVLKLKFYLALIKAGMREDGLRLAELLFANLGDKYDKDIYDVMAEAYCYAGELLKGARLYEKIYRQDKDFFARIKAMSYYSSVGELAPLQVLAFEALRENPESAQACCYIGRVRQGCFQYGLAAFWYRRALALSPDDQDAKEKLAEMENHFAKHNSGSPQTLYGDKIMSYDRELGSLAARIKSLNKAWNDNPGPGRAMTERQAEDVKKRAEVVKKELARLSKLHDDLIIPFNDATQVLLKGDYEKAISMADDILRTDSRLGCARFIKATAYAMWGAKLAGEGKNEEAIEKLTEAVNYEGRVRAPNITGQIVEVPFASELAALLLKKGSYKTARSPERFELWNRAWTLDPDRKLYEYYAKLGMSSEEVLRENASTMLNFPREAILEPAQKDEAHTLFLKGVKSAKENKFKDAVPAFEESLSKREAAETYQALAMSHLARAKPDFAKAVQYVASAADLYEKKQTHQAVLSDEAAKKLAARAQALIAATYYIQALRLSRESRFDEAIESYKQALPSLRRIAELDPEHPYFKYLALMLEEELKLLEKGFGKKRR